VTARGGILLEAMIAMALFVGAALTILRASSQASMAVEEASKLQSAVDLATTRLTELEVGLISLTDLRSGRFESRPEFGDLDQGDSSDPLLIEARTERTAFEGLVLLELHVLDSEREASDGGARRIYSIRKLVRLSEEDVEAYEQDELLDDLPPIEETEDEPVELDA